jgi:hypothetical protein
MVIKQLLVQGVKLVRHVLHLTAVVTKQFIKLKDASLTVAKKLSLDSKPLPSGRLQWFMDNLLQLEGESQASTSARSCRSCTNT